MIEIRLADLNQPEQAAALVALMDEYARDPMGGGEGLAESVKAGLPSALKDHPGAFQVLAWKDGQAVGLINCFEGFSTFKCQPLINIHDVIVSGNCRGQGVALLMLDKVEAIARERGCCKMTLEVLQGNLSAQKSYRKAGFAGYELDPEMGHALFWEKKL